MAYELLSQSRKPNKWGSPNKSRGLENVLKKNKCTGGRGGGWEHLLGTQEYLYSYTVLVKSKHFKSKTSLKIQRHGKIMRTVEGL